MRARREVNTRFYKAVHTVHVYTYILREAGARRHGTNKGSWRHGVNAESFYYYSFAHAVHRVLVLRAPRPPSRLLYLEHYPLEPC